MKLWILKPADLVLGKENPWEPWYDKCFGFVIRAEDEASARLAANEQAGDEVYPDSGEKTAWLDPSYSTCDELQTDGEAGILMKDFRSI